MTAPKSCSNCGAAPAPAASLPHGRACAAPAVAPFRPGAGSPGTAPGLFRVRRRLRPEQAPSSRRPAPQAPGPSRSRQLDSPGTKPTPSSAPCARWPIRTTIRPRNTSIRRLTTSANTPPRQSRRPGLGSTARCSSRSSRSSVASCHPPTVRLKPIPPPALSPPSGLPDRRFPFKRRCFAGTKTARCEKHEKRRGMLAHATPSCSRTTDRMGGRCYSASAPPARRIASVTMPTLVTPAPLAASITSMISP